MVARIGLLLMLAAGMVPARWGEGTHAAAPANRNEMFGHQFYPTPEKLIERMLEYYPMDEHDRLWERNGPKRILEPSAGSGAILEYIARHAGMGRNNDRVLHCCELDPELNAMLQGKGFTVVGSDFLEFKTENPYDLIIMNPPFDTAARHIVHAWELLNGELVALCNAETIRNPRGEHAVRLQQLLEQGGKVTYVGQPFADALRRTDVEVALVRLTRNQDAEEPDWWKNADLRMETDVEMGDAVDASTGVVRYDVIDSLVNGYRASQNAFRELAIARARAYAALSAFSFGSHEDPLELAIKEMDRTPDEEGSSGAAKGERVFRSELQRMAWTAIFSQTNFKDYATAGVERNLKHLLGQQQAMAFDRENIIAMLELLFNNRHEILRQAMLETFDRLCSYFTGNRSHWEGWKSNDAHMVNRRIVVPSCGLSYDRRWGGSFTTYNINLDDIDRTMAMLEGRKLSDPTRIEHLKVCKERYRSYERSLVTIANAIKISIAELPTPIENHHFHDLDNTAESEYFLIKYWKKGTVHLYFKDEQLWQRFNQEAAKGKNWLPFDPNKVPTPKTKPSERAAIRELEQMAEVRRQRALNAISEEPIRS